jgi:adenosylcobinamide kinase/adenosylcobinamide-phosphate guanylyltransferase
VKKFLMNKNKKIIFITGGARSGKSRFAQGLAQGFSGPKAYLATAQALDEEMAERIRQHKMSRPPDWHTLEEPLRLTDCLREQGARFHVILLDCLTLWLSNILLAGWTQEDILQEADQWIETCRKIPCSLILVGNEVGMGIVPDNPQARIFRDLNGWMQQKIAQEADEVYFMVSGLAQKMKG